MEYVVAAASGLVLRWGNAGQEAAAGERIIEIPQVADPSAVYFVGDDARPLPAKPFAFLDWDPVTEEWFDPRTVADQQAELSAWRTTAKLTKLAFLQRCLMFGILTPSEALQGTREVPVNFQPIVAGLPAEMRDMAALNWAGATEVDRLDPFILAIADAVPFDDDTLDILFGLAEPGFGPL